MVVTVTSKALTFITKCPHCYSPTIIMDEEDQSYCSDKEHCIEGPKHVCKFCGGDMYWSIKIKPGNRMLKVV